MMRLLVRLMVMCALLGTGLLAMPASPVAAADAVVSGACSEDDFDAALTLVQNTEGGTITFNCDEKPATITFDSEKTITTPVEIDGGGQVTLDGQGGTRLFFIDGAQPNAALTLRDIAVTGGSMEDADGGAIYNDGGTLTIIDSMLSGNSVAGELSTGGAIYNTDGSLTISSSTLSGNEVVADGGAIFNAGGGTVTISDSTLSENISTGEVGSGGAIFNGTSGTLRITGSTLSGNIAHNAGAIFNAGSLTISSSTLSGNRAVNVGGAIYNAGSGLLQISSSTLSGNQAGSNAGALYVFIDATTTLHSSIIDVGESTIPACFVASGGSLESQGYNLSTDDSCDPEPILGDLSDTNPMLEPLGNYGGPTQTHRPQPGSPVIDHIPAAECATDEQGAILPDQRGVDRPYPADGNCDIGSVEFRYLHSITITPTIDGDEVVVTVTTGDLDTGELTYTYDCDSDGSDEPDAGSGNVGRCPLLVGAGGSQQIKVSVSDGFQIVTGTTRVGIAYELCASRGTGDLHEASAGGCGRYARAVTLPEDGPLTVCVNRSTGELRLVSTSDDCTRYEELLVLPDEGPITVCIHRSTGELRVPFNEPCTRYEELREIGGSVPAV